MRIGVCPGSFDPVTNGHVDIFERGSRLVDKLIIAVSSNPNKNSLFSMEERVEMIRNSVKHIPNVEIDCTGGLLNEYVKSKNATIIIRGLRALSDFEYEFQRALFAKYLDDDIETVFIMTNNKYSFVSSTGIRELAKFGGKLDGLVPDDVKEKLEERFAQRQAETLIDQAKDYIAKLTAESELVKQAQEQANQIINAANQSSDELKASSIQYAGDVLKYVENNLEKTLESLRQNRESLKQTEQRTEENQ
ncbi:MAG: pantetheine-phosphate adenylyltransferase [Veillonella sp.]|nr:pantetheine-phosphate adenylyltransferase [Veillonella sp.]